MSLRSCAGKLKLCFLRRRTAKHAQVNSDHDKMSRLTDHKEEAREKKRYQVAIGKLHLKRDACDLLQYAQEDLVPEVSKPVITVSTPDGRTLYPHDKREWQDHLVVETADSAFDILHDALIRMLNEIAQMQWKFASAVKDATPHVTSLADPESRLNKALIERIYIRMKRAKQDTCELIDYLEGIGRIAYGRDPSAVELLEVYKLAERWIRDTSSLTDQLDLVVFKMMWRGRKGLHLDNLTVLFENIVEDLLKQ